MHDDAGGVDDAAERGPAGRLDPRRDLAGQAGAPPRRGRRGLVARRRRSTSAARRARRTPGRPWVPTSACTSGRCSTWSTDGRRRRGSTPIVGGIGRIYTHPPRARPRPRSRRAAWYPARLWVGSARRTSRTACPAWSRRKRRTSRTSPTRWPTCSTRAAGRGPSASASASRPSRGRGTSGRSRSPGGRPSTARRRARTDGPPRGLRRGRGARAARPLRARPGGGPAPRCSWTARRCPTRTSCGCRSSGSSSAGEA